MGKSHKKAVKLSGSDENLIIEKELPLKYKATRILLVMYLVSVAVRFLLALLYTHGPTVIIDENLYTSIAKSLAFEGKIAYRRQPVDYFSILYPLLLVPLYWIRFPFDVYRVIQLYNTFLICSAAFPAYRLSRKFTGSERKALLAAGITLLMPDMKMAAHLMSECIIWPLTLWVFCFAFEAYNEEENRIKNCILAGAFSALLFWTKPGSFAFGAAILAVFLIFAIRDKDREKIRASLYGLATLAGMIIFFYLLYIFVFGYDMTVLGLYDKQVSSLDPRWIPASAESSVLQIVLLILAAGGIYGVVPFAYLKEYEPDKRRFIIATAIGIAVTAIGTAVFVVMYGWNGSFTNIQLHLRYMAMFIPVLFIFSQPVASRKSGPSKRVIILLLVAAALYIFPGARVGFVRGESTHIDSLALCAFLKHSRVPAAWGIVLTVFSTVIIVFLCMELKRGLNSALKTFCAGYFVLFLLCNNVCTYLAGNALILSERTDDALELNAMIEEEPAVILGITQQYYDDVKTFWQEGHTRKPMHQVTVDNILYEAMETGGVYVPFVPVEQAPVINPSMTPDTDVFLLGETIAEHLELSDSVQSVTTANGFYTLAHITSGERWLDSGLFGMNDNTLAEGKTAYLSVYDESRYDENGEVQVHIIAKAEKEGTVLKATCGGVTATIALDSEYQTYDITLPKGDIVIKPEGGDAEIQTYTTGA